MAARRRIAHVEGSGLAAAACHVLLRRFGWASSGEPPIEPSVPVLVINQATGAVLADLFGGLPSGHICPRRLIVRHNVAGVAAVDEPHLVVSSWSLQRLMPRVVCGEGPDPRAWGIQTSPIPICGPAVSSGSRSAWLFEAEPLTSEARRTCIFEFTRQGWLFWAPSSERTGLLQCVLPSAAAGADACGSMFGETGVLRRSIAPGALRGAALPCSALGFTRLAQGNSICCGGAALRYDPISGDGTGASLRSAILACAVLRYASETQDAGLAFDHFRARIGRAFRGHVSACERLYREADLSPAWEPELAAMRAAIQASGVLFPEKSALRFELRDYALA